MYLRPAEVAATLAVVARRSTPGSHLAVVYYHRPALRLRLNSLFLRRLGEPLRSTFRPEAVRAPAGAR